MLEDVDTRDKRGHDASCVAVLAMRQRRLCRNAARLGRGDQFQHGRLPIVAHVLSVDRHAPRKRGIQYAAAFRFITGVSEYRIIRFRG